MDFEPDQEQRLIVETVRRFVQEEIAPLEGALDPDASELEAEDRARLVAKVKEMGFYGLDIPEEYGGPGVDIVTRTLMAIEMSPAPGRPLCPLLRRFSVEPVWRSSTRPMTLRRSSTCTPRCAGRSAVSSA